MLDSDLADLYQVETRTLNQAIRRNLDRFPGDFMFQLTPEEAAGLRSQIVILEKGRGRHSKYTPLAFTEHGIAMLSWILRSKRAVQVNILIVRAFVKMRELLTSHADLAERFKRIEADQKACASIISVLVDEIENLKRPIQLPAPAKRPIGFKIDAARIARIAVSAPAVASLGMEASRSTTPGAARR